MQFGFTTHDVVRRRRGIHGEEGLSGPLRRSLLAEAAQIVRNWIDEIGLGDRAAAVPLADVEALERHIDEAIELELFNRGGVPRRNFVALSLINYYLHPQVYLESGYFRGCSVFAAFFNSHLTKVVGFDPLPRNFRLKSPPSGVEMDLRQEDFDRYEGLECSGSDALAYFDDHINTAARILSSADKGLKHVIFDDSCGVTGTSQRKWPSMPTLFFIQRHSEIAEGETLTWRYRRPPSFGPFAPREIAVKLLGKSRPQTFECRFDRQMLEMCRAANDRIDAVYKIPDLSDFIYEPIDRGVELTQHFVVLK